MNRRSFLRTCLTIPAAAIAARAIPWAPEPVKNELREAFERAAAAMSQQHFDCASMRYVLVHPNQLALARSMFKSDEVIARAAMPTDTMYVLDKRAINSAMNHEPLFEPAEGLWRAACPT